MSPFDAWITRYGFAVIRWRWWVLAASVVLAFAVGSGAQHLTFNPSYKVFFGPDNPQLVEFENIQNTYTKNDNILFVLEPRDGTIYSREFLTALQAFTDAAWQLPYALRVDSLTNFQYSRAFGDDLVVTDLVEEPANLSDEQLQQIREVALAEPLLNNFLIDADGEQTAVNVTFQLPQTSLNETPEAVAAARALVERITTDHPSVKAGYMTGVMMINNAFREASENDFMTMIPVMYVFILVLVGVLLRSVSSVIVTFLLVLLSTVVAIGVAGFAGVELTPPSTQVPILIMTLAVADTIHILFTLGDQRRRGKSNHEAIVESLRLNFSPVLVTSVTTAIGFLSLNFNDSPPFHDIGNMTAVGIMAAWLFSITLLPAWLAIVPVKSSQQQPRFTGLMRSLADWVIARQRLLLWGMTALVIIIMTGIPLNKSDDRFIQFFDESIQFRTDSQYVLDHLTGIYTIHYSLDAGQDEGVSDPAYLAQLDAFKQWLQTQPEVIHVQVLSDTMKRLNRNMHGDDPAKYHLPDSKELGAQYLLLYELSLSFGLDLNNTINISKSASRLVLTIENISSSHTREFVERTEQWLKQNTPLFADAHGVSPSVMFSHISKRSFDSMVEGSIVALVGISLLLIIALGSLKIGLLSLVPNLAPLAIAFGIWGYTVEDVNFAMAIVMGMTLGIVVDDTVHILSKYLRARRELDYNAEDSVRYAFESVGGALLILTLVLLAGFVLLAQSAFYANSSVAGLTAIAIGAAIIADFLLLPPLLLRIDKDHEQHTAPAAA